MIAKAIRKRGSRKGIEAEESTPSPLARCTEKNQMQIVSRDTETELFAGSERIPNFLFPAGQQPPFVRSVRFPAVNEQSNNYRFTQRGKQPDDALHLPNGCTGYFAANEKRVGTIAIGSASAFLIFVWRNQRFLLSRPSGD